MAYSPEANRYSLFRLARNDGSNGQGTGTDDNGGLDPTIGSIDDNDQFSGAKVLFQRK